MRRALGHRRRLLLAAASAILVVSVGIAYAAIPGASGVINGCYSAGQGQLRVIDADKGESCKNNETAISWNQKGVQGDKGDKGEKGDKGDTGPQGIQGAVGPQGPQGATGPQGEQGLQGAQGAKGDTGAAGPAGAQGPAGPQGAQGPPGSTTFTGKACSANGIFCFEISDHGVFITRAGHKVLSVKLSDVELPE